jgi:hypothetical protein
MLKLLFFLLFSGVAFADEFTDLGTSLGTVANLAGKHQIATNDEFGVAFNFWKPAFEGGPASAAELSNPHMSGADAFGNVYIADKAGQAILKITTDGNIHTFAGTHAAGFNGDGPAPATSLQINNPNGLYVFPNGTVYLLDPGNHRIRKVDLNGVMTTVVNDPDPAWYPSGRALWVSPAEDLIYYTHELAVPSPGTGVDGAVVKKWTPTGGIEVVCSKAVGFRNPGNIAVHPISGKLYVTDRAEDDGTRLAVGLFRIDAPEVRSRITGNASNPLPFDGQSAATSFIDQTRAIAFLPNGSYFIGGHKDGNVWFVDTAGILHRYLRGRATKDYYNLTDGLQPPLTGFAPNGQEWYSQPRSLTIAPNGDLLVVCADSGFVFKVRHAGPRPLPTDLSAYQSTSTGISLRWTGVYGRGYLVQRSWDLLTPDWQVIGAGGGDVVGVPMQYLDPATAGHGTGFYRLSPAP